MRATSRSGTRRTQGGTTDDGDDAAQTERTDGHDPYDRRRELTRLIALWPQELDDTSLAGQARLLSRLRRALRIERQRGLAGNWTYDLARHARLLRAYRSELSNFNARLGNTNAAVNAPQLNGAGRPSTATPRGWRGSTSAP